MNIIKLSLLSLIIMAISACTTVDNDDSNNSANQDNRIQFAPGASSAMVSGSMTGFDSEDNYVINVNAGQTMNIQQVGMQNNQYVSLYLTAPNGADANDMDLSCHSKATVSPTMAGDYKIKVVECKKADPWKGNYQLKVIVQ